MIADAVNKKDLRDSAWKMLYVCLFYLLKFLFV